jgi:hypothetical protein
MGFHPGNRRPTASQLNIQRYKFMLLGRNILFGLDGVYRALWDTHRAINTFIRINHEHVGAFAKAINWTDINAIGVFAFDTALGNDVGHGSKQKSELTAIVKLRAQVVAAFVFSRR